jgi:nucleoid-associated protein YgaU
VVTLLLVLEPGAGRELTGLAGCPRAVRRALVTLCGVALSGAALVTPAQAHGDHSAAQESRLDGLTLPDRMSGPERPRPAAAPRTVVVRPGDTLWAIAADRLPTGAALAAVDRAWRSLYTANRAVIGPDPDLIRAGAELRLPPVLQPVLRPVTEEENR